LAFMIKFKLLRNIYKIQFLGVAVLFLFNIQLFAQEYKVSTYSSKQGLNNNFTKAVAQDSLGFIWIATDNGLERFNGLDFQIYTNNIPSNYVKSFFKPQQGGLLAVTDMGIIKIISKPDTAEFITIARGSSSFTDSLLFYPKLIFQDHKQNFWIADNNSIWLFKNNRLKKYTFTKKNFTINFQRSFAITENRFDKLYVFSETGYTYLYNREEDKFIEQKNIPKFPSVDGAEFIDDSRILIASYKGVFVLDISGEKPEVENILQTDACKIKRLNDSVYFIGSWTNGIHKCTVEHNKIVTEKITSIRNNKINNIFIDKKENLWLSSDFGLILAQNLPFNSMSQMLNRIFVQSIDIAPDGQTYCIAGDAYSIVKQNGKLDTSLVYSLSREGNLSQIAACKTDSSVLFITTTNAQLFMLKNRKVIRSVDLSSYGRVLFYLTCDWQNNLWACLDGCDGVLKISSEFEVELIDEIRGLDSRGIVVRNDSNGNLYCGGMGDSTYLFKYDYSSGMFNNVSSELPFSHSKGLVVNDMAFQNGQIYLATSEGVVQKKGDTVQRIGLGKYSGYNVNCIASDNDNSIWFSNEKGLFKYESGNYYVFSENDGLNTTVGSYRCLAIDKNNKVWFGTQTGLNYSMAINETGITRQPVFTNISVDGKSVSIQASDLKINKYSFIRFAFISVEMPGNDIVYKTRLLGLEAEWSAEKSENEVLLSHLPVGEYTLNVKARQYGNYDWSDVSSFTFTVEPNWYQTWWAYSFYFLCFILLLVLFNALYHKSLIRKNRRLEYQVKIRTDEIMSKNKQLQYLNVTKDKFFSIIAHDLKNPFSSILGLIQVLRSNFDNYDEEKKHELIELIHTSTKDTYSLLENLLSWAGTQTNAINFKPESINLAHLIKDATDTSAAAIHSKNIRLIYRVNSDLEIMADRNMLTTVVRNLIVNAIKYSYRNESIIVEAIKEHNYIKVSVIDNGVGINPKRMAELFKISKKTSEPGTDNEIGTGLGLILCKEFVKKHGGKIDVKSAPGKGSHFWFQIPV